MAQSFGYQDTTTTKLQVPVPTLSYAKDFSVKSETPTEVVLTNTTSPLDQPETLRFAIQNISNIYSGTGIDPAMASVTKRGVSLVVQLNDILRITPDADAADCCCTAVTDLPISTHIVIRTPLNSNISADTILSVVERNIAALFDGKVASDRLNAMLRGALKPSSM